MSGAGSAADRAKSPTASGAQPAARRRRWRRIKWTIRLGVLLAAAGFLRFVGFDGKFYYPDGKTYFRPADLGLECEDVTFRTRDGLQLHGWFLPAVGRARGTVVHFHGNAANITNHVVLVSWLPAAGYNVLMFDYRGYGQSEGRPTRAGTITDGHAAIDYALSRAETGDGPLLVYGQSLGGAVAVVVAAERPEVAGVVVESTFSGYRRIAARHLRRVMGSETLARFLAAIAISGGDDPIDVVGRIAPRPLLVIAGERDEICFPELGRELFDAAAEPKGWWLAPQAEHLAILEQHDIELRERVVELFEQAAAVRAGE